MSGLDILPIMSLLFLHQLRLENATFFNPHPDHARSATMDELWENHLISEDDGGRFGKVGLIGLMLLL